MEIISSDELAIVNKTDKKVFVCNFDGKLLREWQIKPGIEKLERLSSTKLLLVNSEEKHLEITTHDGKWLENIKMVSWRLPSKGFSLCNNDLCPFHGEYEYQKIVSGEACIKAHLVKRVVLPERNSIAILTVSGMIHICHLVLA